MKLYDYQIDALRHMKNGCILCGGVGSGKSRTSLAYFHLHEGGRIDDVNSESFDIIRGHTPKDLYIITTARKRDTLEWEGELAHFLMSPNPDANAYKGQTIVIDSWNNIKKYKDVGNSFFIFDEDRVIGKGEWVKAFINIARNNSWILLSATPGDTWVDYIPVFIANGFYRNRSHFVREHVVYSRFSKYPKVDKYVNTGRLEALRRLILVDMDFHRHTIPHHEAIYCTYDMDFYKDIQRNRWNPWEERPIESAAELCYSLRKAVNSDESRSASLLEIFETHPKIIVFYNYNYELDILRSLNYGDNVVVAEWNGQKHEPIPKSESWVYLVQYTAGAEGWNCIATDTIVFWSQSYSYKVMVQAAGRIDRLNTPFTDLYFYHLKTRSGIDLAISKALKAKKQFNEKKFVKW